MLRTPVAEHVMNEEVLRKTGSTKKLLIYNRNIQGEHREEERVGEFNTHRIH